MKESTSYFIKWFIIGISIAGGGVLLLFLLRTLILLVMIGYDYSIVPDRYRLNLSGKEMFFIKTSNYFMSLTPEQFKDGYRLTYNKEDKIKRSIWLRSNSSDSESYSIKNVNYNSKELDSFINNIGIKKEQLDTLETYLSFIKCNYISIPDPYYDKTNVELKMKIDDITTYHYYDSVSYTRHYAYDTVTHREFCDSIIVRKGKHILVRTLD